MARTRVWRETKHCLAKNKFFATHKYFKFNSEKLYVYNKKEILMCLTAVSVKRDVECDDY